MRNLVSLRALSLVMGLLAVVGWGAFAFAIKSSSETERRLNEQVAELTVREGQLIAERDQARAEAAELRASRDQRVAERVDVQAQLAVAREEIARLQKQVEQLHAKASVTGSIRALTPLGKRTRPPNQTHRSRR